ncbi:ATP-dependent DNA helicase RecG [Stackebrandtia nassauensis]|uniref:Probable DNA 3'-5' helicase RecG n=1 Tax=Stackebrandtia nassauensis (strain DSM 44728 / CIP 108903 / NRRL B-16338 / NBRC 102104 / LLR-40K-21) TaxID=446470 RepID=D3Q0S4_STANL|nr:ATP-dependent DNA helicase RecG [Stackebrandtia nassauensis]ADD41810.1 ATP-dependent DNA helicase RecG [Stackebrandtia nassauensis DSM 44728]
MATLDTKLSAVVGAKTATALANHLDMAVVGDLIHHYPFRYAQRGERTDLDSLEIGEQATVLAQVRAVTNKPMRSRRGSMLEVVVSDDDGRTLTLTFFNQPWQTRYLKAGRWGLFSGKVTEFRGRRQLNGPDFRMLADPDDDEAGEMIEEFAGALIPVYRAAGKVPTWTIARCVRVALDVLEPPADPLPEDLRHKHSLIGFNDALHAIHRPESTEQLYAAKKRLKWQEAFSLQLTLVQRKARAATTPAVPRPGRDDGLLAAFDAKLPFELTDGQREVGDELAAALSTPHPMHRLLQGDVGAGKTLVSVRAMLQVVDSGAQAVLLAPTEVLAAQHYRTILKQLGDLGRGGELGAPTEATRVTLVTGSLGAKAKREALASLADGSAGIVVGTHALLYEGVDFADLGLVVVDEQHRFGVEQRDALRAKASDPPHVLVMTATPIPRTVAMTVYGDLETSKLGQLPQGRSPIKTHVVPGTDERWVARSWQRLREEVGKGHQAYVVCPRVGDDDKVDDSERRAPLAVLDVGPRLADGPLSGLKLGILHGRMPPDEKDAVMGRFSAGELDVLVATTVIEVGVDVPNATMMVIMDAERFGVSQLHQLRGRVGRGSAPGLCLLVTEANAASPSGERLEAVASTTDGFRLAELDLEQRREGDVLGDAQSGAKSHVRLLSLLRDAELIGEARAEAVEVIAADPELERHPRLAAAIAALVDDDRAEYLEKS